MAGPPWKVEIALTSSPGLPLASQTWTDVTASVLTTGTAGSPIDVRYGRADEDAQVVPATLSLVLDNTDGRWSPGSTSAPAPMLGNVRVGKLIRVTVTSGSDYRRFVGHVDAWRVPEWAQAGGHKVVQVTAVDRLQRLTRAGTMRSILETVTLGTGPRAYWPLGEPTGSSSAESITAAAETPLVTKQRIGTGVVEFGASTGVGTDALPAPLFQPTVSDDDATLLVGNAYLGGTLSPAVSWGAGNAISLACWFDLGTVFQAPTVGTLMALENPGVFYADLTIDDTGQLIGTVADLTGGTTKTVSGPILGTDRTHLVVLTAIPGGNLSMRVYRDGVTGFTTWLALSLPSTARTASVVTVGDAFGGTISHAAVWARALTSDEQSDLWEARRALGGWPTGSAAAAVAAYAGVPAAEITVEPGMSQVGAVDTQGRSPVAVLQEIAAAEDGAVFADRSGVIRLHDRGHRLNPGAPTLTIAAATGDPIHDLGFRLDDERLRNDSAVARTGGGTFRTTDAGSVSDHGLYAEQLEVNVASDAEAQGRAAYRVAAYAQPLVRASAFVVDVTTSAAPAAYLGLDIGSLIAITGLTSDQPALGALWVEGWQESIGMDLHSITFNTSPVLLPGTTFFVIGSSAIGGTDVLAY